MSTDSTDLCLLMRRVFLLGGYARGVEIESVDVFVSTTNDTIRFRNKLNSCCVLGRSNALVLDGFFS